MRKTRSNWVPIFLKALAYSGIIGDACRVANIDRKTFYNLRDKDEDFAELAREALEDAADLVEREAYRRSVEGIDEPVIHQGQMAGVWLAENGDVVTPTTPGARLIPLTVKKYSNPLLGTLLKAYQPKKYGDKMALSGPNGEPLRIIAAGVPVTEADL